MIPGGTPNGTPMELWDAMDWINFTCGSVFLLLTLFVVVRGVVRWWHR